MSADNWDECPECKKRDDERLRTLAIQADDAYGKVSVDEFDRLRTELEDARNEGPDQTFREDYEFWIAEGVVHFSYSGRCQICDAGVKFEGEHPIEPADA